MKPNGVSAVLCLGMQLRRSMMVLWPCHCNRCDWLPRNNYFDWLLLPLWRQPIDTMTTPLIYTEGVYFYAWRTMPGAFLWLFFDSTRQWSYPERYECFGSDDCCSTALLCIASGVPRQMLMCDWCVMLSALTLWSTLMLMSRDLVVHEMNGQSVVTSI